MSTQVESSQKIEAQFRVGEWLVAPSLNRVVRDGSAVQLGFKAMDLLICLAERAGELVAKRELVDTVWQTEYVADNTLTKRVAELREAFGDDARNPSYIETIPKRGYRLIAEVDFHDDAQKESGEAMLDLRADERSPYRGLEPFTEGDAHVFFGRESEIAALWRKIAGRRLLAVIGPSGAGKSSLVRAGVVARAPPGWRAVVCQPGEEPFLALARALAPDLADDAEEMRQLLGFHDPDVALAVVARWRGRWNETLIVVDQFEELFTLNPESVQKRFVDLQRRLVDAAGIHLALVLRDDFLLECHRHPSLAPIFSDLTPVGPPPGPELRKALIEPAARRLHVFESETLVDEMVSEVEDERGALPLLAFAVSRLWELRDRERRMLTREAYETIGGVGGALAQHAEATLETIGRDRLPIVRELFRNLVTAQGTRATRQWDDLLSIFNGGGKEGVKPSPKDQARDDIVGPGFTPAREVAEEVLLQLIDARLLTSFEDIPVDDDDVTPTRRIEIVHESLLRSWPRLVRWQTQDADAAQLRDQLRQAARLWQERRRPAELLWTGTPYRELMVWREGYPGGLTAIEQAFVDATIRQASRRRRRTRIIGAAVMIGLTLVAIALGALWLRSERQARRIEARRLEAIARRTMEESPPNALAYALASLEIVDSNEARRLALEAVWRSPMPLMIGGEELPGLGISGDLSQDGRWLSVGHWDGTLALWSREGSSPSYWRPSTDRTRGYFTPDSKALLSFSLADPSVTVWSVPELSRIGSLEGVGFKRSDVSIRRANVMRNLTRLVDDPTAPGGWRVDLRALERCEAMRGDRLPAAAVLPDGSGYVAALGDEILGVSLDHPTSTSIRLARVQSPVDMLAVSNDGERLATVHADGDIKVWGLSDAGATLLREWSRQYPSSCNDLRFHPSGNLLVVGYGGNVAAVLGLTDPPGSDGLELALPASRLIELDFSPAGDWLSIASMRGVGLWPLARERLPFVLRGHAGVVEYLAFLPDGRSLVSQGADGSIRLWPLEGAAGSRVRVLHEWGHPAPSPVGWMTLSPDGKFLVTTCNEDVALVVPLDGSAPTPLGGFDNRVLRAAIGGEGRWIAVPGRYEGRWIVRRWDLEAGTKRDIDLSDLVGEREFFSHIAETSDGRILITGKGGTKGAKGAGSMLFEVDPETGSRASIADGVGLFIVDGEDNLVVSRRRPDGVPSVATIHDLDAGTASPLSRHGSQVLTFALDQSGSIVATGGADEIVRVGPVSGETPHWLVGHTGTVTALAISPDGRTIASGGHDGTIRLWPMPELSRPPVHDLPRDEFLNRLGSLTNRRVIRDPDDPEAYRIEIDPFPGWATVPEWR